MSIIYYVTIGRKKIFVYYRLYYTFIFISIIHSIHFILKPNTNWNCMSVFCVGSGYLRRHFNLLFLQNIRKVVIFLWCSLSVIFSQIKNIFTHSFDNYRRCHQRSCLLGKMAKNSPTIDNLNTKNGNFICGVVEGNLHLLNLSV